MKTDILFFAEDPLRGAISLQCAHPLIGLVVSNPEVGPDAVGVVLEKANRTGLLNALRQIADGPVSSEEGDLELMSFAAVDFAGNGVSVHHTRYNGAIAVGIATSAPTGPTMCAFLLGDNLNQLIDALEQLADVEDMTPEEAMERAKGQGL